MDLTLITTLLTQYGVFAILLGSFFFGESFILTATLLAERGYWSLETVFFLSLLGTVVSDSLWFFFGSAIMRFIRKWRKGTSEEPALLRAMEKITRGKPFLILLIIKFLYGSRILTIVYLSVQRVPFWLFTIFNTLGTIIWLVVLLTLGSLIGASADQVTGRINDVGLMISGLILTLILLKLFTSWIKKRLLRA